MLILAILIASLVGTSPVQASVTCPAGTYLSSFSDDICEPAPPGTFTQSNGSLDPMLCPPGMYQPYYGQSGCYFAPAGTYVPEAGATSWIPCPAGAFTANFGESTCTPAGAGKYVPFPRMATEIDCPLPPTNATANISRVGNSNETSCYDFGNTNVLVTPVSGGTYDFNLPIEVYARSGVVMNATRMQIRYDDVNNYGMNWEFNTPALAIGAGTHTVFARQPRQWFNTESTFGCYNGCQYGIPREHLPAGTYDLTIKLISTSNNSTLATYSVANVTINDSVTETPLVADPQFVGEVFDDETVIINYTLPEDAADDSVIINLVNAPSGMGPSKTRTYQLNGAIAFGSYQLEIPLSGSANLFSSNFDSSSGDAIEPGLWWVKVTYQDDPAANSTRSAVSANPFLVSQVCAPGFYSPKGFDTCIQIPAGSYGTYPAAAGFDATAKLYRPTLCPAGSYQAVVGFTGNQCTSTDPGYFASGTGNASQTQCAAGTYQPSGGQASCVRASVGSFVNSQGAISQTRCPANHTSAAGSDALSDCKPTACLIRKGKTASGACLLTPLGKTIPAKAKVTYTIAKATQKTCKASGVTVKALKAGTCTFKMTVKPKTGRTMTYTVKIIAS